MKTLKRLGTALTLLGLAACHVPAPPPKAASRLPQEVCEKAKLGMDKLKQGGLDQVKPGEVTMIEQAWLELPAERRDQLIQLIGIDAACRAEEPSFEQTVVVRSEFGRVMAQRIVTTSVDLSDLVDP